MWPINSNLMWMVIGTFAVLAMGTAVRMVALRKAPADVVKKRMGSLKVWWILAVLWSLAALLGKIGAATLLAIASFLALREFLRLLGTSERIGYPAVVSLIGCGIIHYALIVANLPSAAKLFFPITSLILLGAVRALAGETENYIRVTGGLFWGGMLMIYGLSHSLFLFDVNGTVEPLVGIAGWFLYLILLTEMNDIMQAIIGRKFGKHTITPGVSPNKTLEGLMGGLVSTTILAVIFAPWLTTFLNGRPMHEGWLLAATSGILISLSGFLGDINMSAIKRDAGVKDGSVLLPGMGGVIDRVDSMIFSGPVFYYFVVSVNQSKLLS